MLKNQKAFTLVELLVTVAVFAIVIALAIPNFSRQISNNRSTALGDSLTEAITSARNEARNRPAMVSLCASSDGATCTGAWTDGFIMFVDTATTNEASSPVVGTILHVWGKADAKSNMSLLRNGTAVTFFRFTSLGVLARIDNFPVVATTYQTGCKGTNKQAITVGLGGVVSVVKQDCP